MTLPGPADDVVDSQPNPYAPPQASAGPSRRRAKFSPLVGVYMAMMAAAVAGHAAYVAGWTRLPLGILGALGGYIVGLAWLYEAWQRIPERLQEVDGHRYTATSLVLRFFIPLYNLYWLFRAQQLLCGALDARLKEKGRGGPVVSGTATLPCLLQFFSAGLSNAKLPPIVSLVAVTLTGLAWTSYMFTIERAFAQAFRKRSAD